MKTNGNPYGMNWISQHKRLAIYLRDGLACAYCGEGVEQGASLCLDHLKSRCDGGSNHETNLVTACKRCNDSKGARSVAEFANAVADYVDHDVTAAQVLKHIKNCVTRPVELTVKRAKLLIAKRGSAAKALAHVREGGSGR
jgi:5-methylcytosine-specific restriction endonuclease McrA